MHALVHARIFTRLSVVRKSLVHDVREGCTGDFVATDILTDEKKFTFPLGFPRLSTFRGNLIPTLTGSFANRSVSRVYPRCVCKDLFFFFESKIASTDENRKIGRLDGSRRESMDPWVRSRLRGVSFRGSRCCN